MATNMTIDSTSSMFAWTSQDFHPGLKVDHDPTSVVAIIEGITLIVIFLGALVANLVALTTTLRDKLLRKNLHNWLIVNLIINDLGVTTTSMTFSIVSVFDHGNILVSSDVMCRINGFGAMVFSFGNFLTILAITVDRYVGVVWSTRFPPSKVRIIIFILLCWMISVLNAMPPIFKFLSDFKYHPDTHHCSPVWNDCLYYIISFTTIFGITVPVMILCYTGVVLTLKRQERLLRSFAKDDHASTPRREKAAPNGMKKERHRVTQSNLSTNMRVALTGILLVMTTVVCWAPYFIVHSCFTPIDSNHWMGVVTMWLGYTNSLLDPLIYSFMNRRVRARYRTMFSWCPGIGRESG